MEAKEELIKKVARLLRREHINYEETKYVFKAVRDKLELKPITSHFQLPKFLSYDEVQKLIEEGYKTNTVYGMIIKTLFITGMRVSELSNLKIEDLFLDDNKIKVVQGKGKKDRIVLINDELKKELLMHLKNRKRGYLFESTHVKQFSKRRLQQIVQETGLKAHITKKVTPHILRHSMATYLLNKGLRLDQVQLLLGHTNPRTTEIYAKTSLEAVKNDFDKIINIHKDI